MSPSEPFVRRPVATTLLMVAIVLAGLIGMRFMPVSALPEVDYPTIQVLTLYPGASPEVMSTTVTAPLERQFGQMPGLRRMSSTSASGASRVTLQFDLDLTLDVAEQEVQAAINAASSLLPVDLPAPPIYAKVNPADAPVLTLAVTARSLPLTTVRDLVDARLAQKISQVSGVGLVNVSGGQRPAVRIQVDTQALASYGISLATLRTTIASANTNSAKGSFDGPALAYTIDANDQLLSPDDYKQLIITYVNGAPVRLSDVADVVIAPEVSQLAAWADRSPAIILDVQRQPGANVIQTVDAVHAQLLALLAGLPAGLDVRVLADRTDSIRASVHDVAMELALAVVLVVAVIFVFLRSVPATLVAALAVPISLTGTLGVVYLLGYSINNLTLMSLTIASGFVVDDAIVMIENIARYVRAGDAPLEAALKGAKQIGFTIISLTVSLIAVLIPLLFMGDVVGRLFREFAVTLAISIIISAIVSLTLTPMLSARWLRRESPGMKKAGIERILKYYDTALGWVLAHQGTTLAIAAATLVLTMALYILIPKGLFPTQDTNQLDAQVRAASSVSFARMSELQESVADTLLDDPAVASVSSFVGVDGANTTALPAGRMFINLRPRAERDAQEVVMNRLRSRAAAISGITLYVRPVQDLTIDAEVGPTQYELSLEGADTTEVASWATRLQNAMRSLPTLRNAVSDTQLRGLATLVSLDRDTAARIGLTAADLDDELYSAFGQRIISTIFTDTNQYRVILEAKPGLVATPENLQRLHLQATGDKATPLTAVAHISQRSAPLQITRVAQFPAATIGFDTAPQVSLGSAVDSIRRTAQEIHLPPSLTLNFLGAPSAYEASLQNELWLIVAAVVCVYIVLGVLYESFVHPLTILSTLPSAGVGALLALLMTGNDLGVIGIIGLILLIGIVKKNAIMMIDFAIDAERGGKSPQNAIHEAALLRLRPILMTTLAALFAAVPLMLGGGEGSELRHPLGIAIFGGLIASQLLTLFTTPVLYLAFDRLAQRRQRRGTDRPGDATHGTETQR